MKTSTIFKRAHNRWLSRLGDRAIGLELGSERYWFASVQAPSPSPNGPDLLQDRAK